MKTKTFNDIPGDIYVYVYIYIYYLSPLELLYIYIYIYIQGERVNVCIYIIGWNALKAFCFTYTP
jgi:hypothetical protein